MLDIHCHIIPGVDDGPKTIDETLAMLKIAEEDGVREIIATPHFYWGHYETPREIINEKVQELNEICEEEKINIKIYAGQELYLSSKTLEHYEKKLIDTIEGTNYMLIELNPSKLHKDTFDILYELKLKGITPIIAHPERYNYVMEDITILNRFIEENSLFQVTAGSIEGNFGSKIKKTAEEIIKYNLCNFIASDGHNLRGRIPAIRRAIECVKESNFSSRVLTYEKFSENYYRNKQIIIENERVLKRLFKMLIKN